jgi:hypothetical protein
VLRALLISVVLYEWQISKHTRFEVLIAVTIKCSFLRFGAIIGISENVLLPSSGSRNKRIKWAAVRGKSLFLLLLAVSFLELLYDPEDEGNICLRNISILLLSCTESPSRRHMLYW